MLGESFWQTANLDAMRQELSRANQERDDAYTKLRKAEREAEEAHERARLTEQRLNYWKQRRGL